MTYALLMPGAGSGTRLGASLPKALVDLAGQAMFVRAVEPFARDTRCAEIVVAAPAGFEARYRELAEQVFESARVAVVTGGSTRGESVARAFRALKTVPDAVLIHDAARPLVSVAVINRVLAALAEGAAAAVPGVPVVDTLKRVAGTPVVVRETVRRADLVAVQTPQGLLTAVAERAFRQAAAEGFEGTDDVSLVEHFRLGAVRVVDGEPGNFKITTREDLERARELLERASEFQRTLQ